MALVTWPVNDSSRAARAFRSSSGVGSRSVSACASSSILNLRGSLVNCLSTASRTKRLSSNGAPRSIKRLREPLRRPWAAISCQLGYQCSEEFTLVRLKPAELGKSSWHRVL